MQPDRPDELARIESLGGHVTYSDGGPRVGGVLAMSRAIGNSIYLSIFFSIISINLQFLI